MEEQSSEDLKEEGKGNQGADWKSLKADGSSSASPSCRSVAIFRSEVLTALFLVFPT